MRLDLELPDKHSEQLTQIFDKLNDYEEVHMLFQYLLLDSIEKFIGVFQDSKGQVQLTPAKVLPSSYKQYMNKQEGKENEEIDSYIIDEVKKFNYPYLRVFDKTSGRVYDVPKEEVVRY